MAVPLPRRHTRVTVIAGALPSCSSGTSRDGWVGVPSACAMQQEFVNHPVSVFMPCPSRSLSQGCLGQTSKCQSLSGTRLATFSWSPPLLADPNCLQKAKVEEGTVLCAPAVRTTHRRMPRAEPPVLAPCPVTPNIDRWSNQQKWVRMIHQFSASAPDHRSLQTYHPWIWVSRA